MEIERLAVDLLLTDVVMPGMTGIELADYLKRRFHKLRIVLMSGYSEEEVHQSASKIADGFVSKPFSAMFLLGEIRKALTKVVLAS